MITYSWKIISVDKTVVGDLQDVVQTVNWQSEATDGIYVVYEHGSLQLGAPNEESFIDFNTLTRQNIYHWLESNLNVNEIKDRLTHSISQLQNKG